jgi:hypothetical protein
MKYTLIGLACSLLILAMPTQAKTVFALNQQFYANSISDDSKKVENGPMRPGRYDTGDAILSMNLSRWSTGVYSTINNRSDGYLIVDVKKPTRNWAANVSVRYGFDYENDKQTVPKTYTIRLTDSNGESLFLSTKRTSISIQDSVFNLKQSLHKTVLNFFAETQGEEIIIKVDGRTFVTMPRGSFSSLKTLEMDVGYHDSNYTYINNVSISQK